MGVATNARHIKEILNELNKLILFMEHRANNNEDRKKLEAIRQNINSIKENQL